MSRYRLTKGGLKLLLTRQRISGADMERAKYNAYYASVLAVVLLLAPQLSFARGMSGGVAGRAGGSSFSSAGSGSARMAFNGRMLSSQPRVLVPNPRSDAFIAAHNSLDS